VGAGAGGPSAARCLDVATTVAPGAQRRFPLTCDGLGGTIEIVSPPTLGTLEGVASGHAVYHAGATPGTDQFTYRVVGALQGTSAPATVTIAVAVPPALPAPPITDPPVGVVDPPTPTPAPAPSLGPSAPAPGTPGTSPSAPLSAASRPASAPRAPKPGLRLARDLSLGTAQAWLPLGTLPVPSTGRTREAAVVVCRAACTVRYRFDLLLRRRSGTRTIVLPTRTVRVAAGHSGSLGLRLDAAARRALRGAHEPRLRLRLRVTGGAVTRTGATTLTLRA
jgi:hypothetical protein